MANIDEYIKQIQQARYGEEVRDSIVNALKKVNDDNNSYVAIKKEVVAAKDIVEEKAEIFDEKANAAKETLTALQASTQIANEAKSSLNNIISSAISTKKELEQAVLETGEVIARVDNAKSNLDKSITSAGKAELNLQRQIETSNQIKNQLDVGNSTAIELKKNLDMAINEANTAKVKLVEAINNAGNTAVENIKTAQNTATQAVETAKTEAVKAVQTEGTTQTGAVTAEGEKQVQAVQTAAQEIIADREQITKNKTEIADLRQNKADAIVETASGTLLNVKDSANAYFEDFSMRGKSEQVQTTGKNLFNVDNIIQKTMPDGKTYWGYSYVLDAGDYTISCLNPNNYDGKTDYLYCRKLLNGEYSDNGIIYVVANNFPQTKKITIEQSEELVFFNATLHNESKSKEKFAKYLFQLEKGASATTYEPYSGGKPSPSPEYLQEIVSAGRLNKNTGKYEIDVKITGKNLIPFPYTAISRNKGTKNGITWEVLTDGGIKLTRTANPETFYLDLDNNLKIGNTLIPPGGTDGRITVNKDASYNGRLAKAYIAVNKGVTVNRVYYPQIEHGTVFTAHEPYKEQTLTITSDRPITKWDRLVEQGGQIGWLYNTGEIMLSEIALWSVQKDNLPDNRTQRIYAILDNAIKNQHCYATKYYSEEPSVSSIKHKDYKCITICNGNYLTLKVDRNIGTTSEDYVNYFRENDDKVIYNSTEQEFVPLPQPEQEAIRALATYYPTTVVSNSEDMEMKLSYVADTKNYTDRKIEQAVSVQIQNLANLLSLMPLSTQAAMIENDTNNILDNMEVQK